MVRGGIRLRGYLRRLARDLRGARTSRRPPACPTLPARPTPRTLTTSGPGLRGTIRSWCVPRPTRAVHRRATASERRSVTASVEALETANRTVAGRPLTARPSRTETRGGCDRYVV